MRIILIILIIQLIGCDYERWARTIHSNYRTKVHFKRNEYFETRKRPDCLCTFKTDRPWEGLYPF